MKPAPFAYARACALDHAIELLNAQEGARVLAGGQSLIATLNMRLDAPRLLVDINSVPGLDRIEMRGNHIEIGALLRHAQALRSPDIAKHAPVLALALPHIAHPAIRNRGTIGGSIALADPAAEIPACLVALDGEVDIAGARGSRTVAAEDFFRGLFETAIEPGEVVSAIRLPAATAQMRYGFAELARRHGDYALVGLAGAAQWAGDKLRDPRLVFFGVGATPVRARAAEAALVEAGIEEAVKALAGDLDPDDDIHANAKTKKHLAGVLLRRVLRQMQEQSA